MEYEIKQYAENNGLKIDEWVEETISSRKTLNKRQLGQLLERLKEGDVLTDEFINALKDEEQQEICHQLNRRTEFIVLRTTYGLGATNP